MPASSATPMAWTLKGPAPWIACGMSANSAVASRAPVAKLTECGITRSRVDFGSSRKSPASSALKAPANAVASKIMVNAVICNNIT